MNKIEAECSDMNISLEEWIELHPKRDMDKLSNVFLLGKNINLLNFFKKNLINLLIILNKNFTKLNKNCYKFIRVVSNYQKINFSKIKKIKTEDYYYLSDYLILLLDFRNVKPKLVIINKNSTNLTLTPGIIFKKLQLKEKKIKKSEKMLNLMIKAAVLNIKNRFKIKNFVVFIKGTKSNFSNVNVLLKKFFKNYNLFYIYSPHIGYGKIKFKKLKAIKRKLRKKFIKL